MRKLENIKTTAIKHAAYFSFYSMQITALRDKCFRLSIDGFFTWSKLLDIVINFVCLQLFFHLCCTIV
jgi:hypothetical protein